MTIDRFAAFVGGLYLFIGSLGALLYVFPVGALHQAMHLAVAMWGMTAASSIPDSLRFARWATPLFLLATVVELTPLRDQAGVWFLPGIGLSLLHVLTAAACAYYGYYWTSAVEEAAQTTADSRSEPRKAA